MTILVSVVLASVVAVGASHSLNTKRKLKSKRRFHRVMPHAK